MQLEPEEAQQNPAVAAFIAELRHWREVAGYSQKALAEACRVHAVICEQGRARNGAREPELR